MALSCAAGPGAAADAPPPWLRPDQVGIFRAALGIARAFGGVMIATPVGSGKTYVGLAVCRALDPGGSIDIVAPAILLPQWGRIATELGACGRVTSHEMISRGGRIDGAGPVLIDESHRFRNQATRRYRELAPQLLGRRVVLLTATPIVNRRQDLAAQLALAVRDDALALYGTPSLRQRVEIDPGIRLTPLIVQSAAPPDRPPRRDTTVRSWHDGDTGFARTVARIDRLRLSRSNSIATLIRGSLLRALASSPSALLASLEGYRRLLGHAADARRAGHPLNRSAIQSIVAGDIDQLVMWDLIDHGETAADLAIGDLGLVERLSDTTRRWIQVGDAKAARLAAILADGKPTLVFTTFTATVQHLRRRLTGTGVAWLTGSDAGYQGRRMPRSLVLLSFDPAARHGRQLPVTTVLLATDVAAEGLNLRSAARIVHYDLPWTPIRLEQRDGRALRPGSLHPDIEVVRFELPAPIEARIGVESILARKREVSNLAPIGQPAADGVGAGWCLVTGDQSVAVFRLRSLASGATGLLVLVRTADTGWHQAENDPLPPMNFIGGGLPCPDAIPDILVSLADPVRQAVERIGAARLGDLQIEAAALHYLRTEAARCRRTRNVAGLTRCEGALRFLRRGHSAAEAALVDRIARGDPAAFDLAGRIGARESEQDTLLAELLVLAVPRSAAIPDQATYRPSDDVATFSV
ncbi:MAG: hypothetical protein KF785_07965 [Gemmatimonadales bacterium]|nr:hypothetical protein [Gemmatimonadales bacterium]